MSLPKPISNTLPRPLDNKSSSILPKAISTLPRPLSSPNSLLKTFTAPTNSGKLGSLNVKRTPSTTPLKSHISLEGKKNPIPIKLLPYQEEKAVRALCILNGYPQDPEDPRDLDDSNDPRNIKHLFYVDNSPGGSGKSIVALNSSQKLGLPPLIVCPSAMEKTWERQCSLYDIEPVAILSYEKLRGSNKYGINKDYAYLDIILNAKGKIGDYQAGIELEAMIDQGILIIIDEYHRVKNKTSLTSKAVKALVSPIVRAQKGTLSRVAFLGCTPVSKLEHFGHYISVFGLITKPRLYTISGGKVYYENNGLGQVINYCRILDQDRTDQIVERMFDLQEGEKFDSNRANLLLCNLYCCVLYWHVAIKMDFETISGATMNRNSAHAIVKEEERERVIKDLEEMLEIIEGGQTFRKNNQLVKLQIAIDSLKIPVIMELIDQYLDKVGPSGKGRYKIIVGVNWIDTLNTILEKLVTKIGLDQVKSRVLIMDGSIKGEARSHAIDKFMAKSGENKCDILLCTIATGGVGLNLQDEFGDAPRMIIGLQSYRYDNYSQFFFRTCRATSMSDTIAFDVLLHSTGEELEDDPITERENSVINSLLRKHVFNQYAVNGSNEILELNIEEVNALEQYGGNMEQDLQLEVEAS